MVIKKKEVNERRKKEKGAALIMALLVSFLVMAAAAALILETSMNSANVTDAAAEQAAYNAAESGIQSVVDVLRFKCTAEVSPCRVRPNPLYFPALADYHKDNKVTFSKAINLASSNGSSDASANSRLSRVLGYTGTTLADRVKLGQPAATYVARTGYAYDLQISDPDNTGSLMSYYTVGEIYDHDAGTDQQISFPAGGGANSTVIRYTPVTVTNLNVPVTDPQPTNFGKFTVTVNGTGAPVDRLIRFEIRVKMTKPYPAPRTIYGYIETQTTSPYVPKIIFDSQTYNLRGSEFTLNFTTLTGYPAWPGQPAGMPALRMSGTQPYGYEAKLNGSAAGTDNVVQGTITSPEPARLRVLSTGYGPRGSVKTLEAIIQNNYFNGLGAPATVTLVGPPTASNGNFTFNPGTSNAMLYSGQDNATGSSDIIPPIGVTNPPDCSVNPCEDVNLDVVIDGFGKKISNTVIGTPSNVSNEVPPWLENPTELDATVKALYQTALNSYDPTNATGRVFTNTNPTSWGDNASGTGITFCDGDCTLGPIAGGGILVVTGKLTLHGNFNWHGLIIVTGSDGVLRDGGGTGLLQGNIVVAPYLNSTIAGNVDPASGAGFLAPHWDTQGNGNSTIQYNSDNQNSGLGAISNVVLGVVEK
jgi:hypothetical protein